MASRYRQREIFWRYDRTYGVDGGYSPLAMEERSLRISVRQTHGRDESKAVELALWQRESA